MSIHHMVVVDAARAEALARWGDMLATFRRAHEDSTVSVLTIDDTGLRTMLAATSVRSAPPSLTVPALSGRGSHEVAYGLLRAVVNIQVQLGDPDVYLYMLTNAARDDLRLKEVRDATTARIRRDPLESEKPRPARRSWMLRKVAVCACVAVALWWGYDHVYDNPPAAPAKVPTPAAPSTAAPPEFIGPEAPTPVESGWDTATVRSVPAGTCVTQYPYASRLNAAHFDVVQCDAATALIRLVQVDSVTAPGADDCPMQSIGYEWVDDGRRYCFVVQLRIGMCVPVQVRQGVHDAYLGIPASCRDQIAVDGRMSPNDALGLQLLQIDSAGPTRSAPPCVAISYVLDDADLSVCTHLFI